MKKVLIPLIVAVFVSFLAPCGVLAQDSENGYILQLNDGVYLSDERAADLGLREISSEAGVYSAPTIGAVRSLGKSVSYYEENGTVQLAGLTNDTYSDDQWNLSSIGISDAWNQGYLGKGVRVAVIDSGVNPSHEDLAGANIEKGLNIIDNSNDVTDQTGHGTFVCGLLAATADNAIGVAGLCDQVTIIPLKCFKGKTTDVSNIISAIYAAVDQYDCDIINLSLGSKDDLLSLRKAVDYATEKGILVISAVGNDGISKLQYPAAYDNVVGVGSIDKAGIVSDFSQKNSSVFITAPGDDIVSVDYETSNTYLVGGGTSFAAPHVTYAAVVLKQYFPNADYEDFMYLLKDSAVDAGQKGYDTSYGWGSLSIHGFMQAMGEYSFQGIEDIFSDVQGHWAKDSINYCYENGYFNGVSANSFGPEQTMTRGMFVTVLNRMSGESFSGYKNPFTDVDAGEYFAGACAWGSANSIVSGTGVDTFDPYGNVTREQMAVFLYRYAKHMGYAGAYYPFDVLLGGYKDKDSISDWAREAMAWAVGTGLMTGRGDDILAPQDCAKRCEVAKMIQRFDGKFN